MIHKDKTPLAAKRAVHPIYPTWRLSSNKGSCYKKPKCLLQWCWASPHWSQRGTLLMSHDTSHLQAQRFKMSAMQDTLAKTLSLRGRLCQCLSASLPQIALIISSNCPLLPSPILPAENLGNARPLIFQQFLITLISTSGHWQVLLSLQQPKHPHFIRHCINGKSLHHSQKWFICGKIKGTTATVLGEQRSEALTCLCLQHCTRKLKCHPSLYCYMNRASWGVQFLPKFRKDEQEKKNWKKNWGGYR